MKLILTGDGLKLPKVEQDKDGALTKIIFDAPFVLTQTPDRTDREDIIIPVRMQEKIKCEGPCGQMRERNEFQLSKTKRTGLQGYCIICRKYTERERRRKRDMGEDQYVPKPFYEWVEEEGIEL
jgi:hypothetical protein